MFDSLVGVRERLKKRVDWKPQTSLDGTAMLNDMINEALLWTVTQAPYLFREKYIMDIEPYVDQGSESDYLAVPGTDKWVLETVLAIGATGAQEWSTDGTWNARRMEIKHKDDTQWTTRFIRDVWTAGGKVRISLDRPWLGETSDLQWHILVGDFHMPPDTVEVNQIVWNQNGARYIAKVQTPRDTVIAFSAIGGNLLYGYGPPVQMAREGFRHLDGPRNAPSVAEAGGGGATWDGPEPAGTFEYAWTIVHGKETGTYPFQNPEEQGSVTATASRYRPFLESGLSPASDEITITSSGPASVLTFPNLDAVHGFDDGSTDRYQHTGLRIRIWRRRTDAPAGTVESSNRWYLLDEIAAGDVTYTDTGLKVPDRSLPYRPSGARSAYKAPALATVAQLEVDYARRPVRLVDDADIVPCPMEAVEAMLLKAMAMVTQAQGNPSGATRLDDEAREELSRVAQMQGSGMPADQILVQRIARPARTRYRSWYRGWW